MPGLLAAQIVTGAGSGIDPAWAIAGLTTIVGTLSTVVGILYRGQVKVAEAESRRKDDLIDELVKQIGRTADVQDRTVSFVERGGPRR